MHREQFAHVFAIERNEVRDLFSFGLGQPQALTRLDLEADVAGRRERDGQTGLQNGTCATHGESGLV
jgi:hypothetical protein